MCCVRNRERVLCTVPVELNLQCEPREDEVETNGQRSDHERCTGKLKFIQKTVIF